MKKKNICTLITTIKAQESHKITMEVIVAKKLSSDEIFISTLTEKARRELEKCNDWIQAIVTTAKVREITFPVFIHEIRVKGVNTINQKQTIKEFYEENLLLHSNLEIIKVAWPTKIIKEEKIYSSLILDMVSPKTANKIIT
jgi:hypothetical protein